MCLFAYMCVGVGDGKWGYLCVHVCVCAHAFVIMLECAELSCMYLYLLTCERNTSFYLTTNRGSESVLERHHVNTTAKI